MIEISIIIPLYNEEESIEKLIQNINSNLKDIYKNKFEIVIINDGSNDKSDSIINNLLLLYNNLTYINLYRNIGKAFAVEIGISNSQGNKIVIIDADLQYESKDILKIISLLKDYYVVVGKRVNRGDDYNVKITSLIFNKIIQFITNVNITDFFSGLKGYRREIINFLEMYDVTRFIVILASINQFPVKEIEVQHKIRKMGSSKYNFFSRLKLAVSDFLTVIFLIIFKRKIQYFISQISFFILILSLIIFLLSIFSDSDMLLLIFKVVCVISIIGIIFKKVGDDFFTRHIDQRKSRIKNIKSIKSSKIK